MITGSLLLLVGRLVLFIHDDKAQLVQRCENSASRSNDNPSMPAFNPVPLVVTLVVLGGLSALVWLRRTIAAGAVQGAARAGG